MLVPAITKCGRCEYCQRSMPSHCQTVGGIGWIFGHLIDGTQAESVRVPYADTSLYAVPEDVTNEQAIFLADSLPTGYEVGVLAGKVRPGDTVAVVGAGAVGLSAILTPDYGAPPGSSRSTPTSSGWTRRGLRRHRHGRGRRQHQGRGPGADRRGRRRRLHRGGRLPGDPADRRVPGSPGRHHRQHRRARRSGFAAHAGHVDPEHHADHGPGRHGVHPDPAEDGGQRPAIPAEKMGTHSFTFAQMDEAYDVFKNAAENSALKVVITPD